MPACAAGVRTLLLFRMSLAAMFSYPHLDLLPEAAAAADSDVGSESGRC